MDDVVVISKRHVMAAMPRTSGDTVEEVRAMIEEAVALHVESHREHGEPVLPPTAIAHAAHAA